MKKKFSQQKTDYSLAHVLYQKLGNDWYAFTEVDGDCFMSKVSEYEAVDGQPTDAKHGQGHEHHKHGRKRRAA